MYKLILSLLFISFISMAFGQALQNGSWGYMQQTSSGSCATKQGTNSTMVQNAFGYQVYNNKGQLRLVNITVNTDNTIQGVATLWYSGSTSLAGYAPVKGVVYNQYSFQAVLLPTRISNGATYFYSFVGCPTSSRLGETEIEHYEVSHDSD